MSTPSSSSPSAVHAQIQPASRPPGAPPVPRPLLIGALALLVLACLLAALGAGPVTLDWVRAVTEPRTSMDGLILWQVRLPRALLAAMIGATLGLSGAALQGLLRNPLASPGLIGVTNCAALGAILMLYFGLAAGNWLALPLGGMLGAAGSVVLIYLLAGHTAGLLTLILAGIAMNAVVSAGIALALNFAPNPYAVSEMVFWLLGSVANRSFAELGISVPFMVVGGVLMLSCGRYLDALSLGEDTAATLGFAPRAQRWRLIIGVALAVGAAVAVSGSIGFVGLVVPHVLRPLVGYQPRPLLAASALGGAALLLLADVVVQALPSQQELKLGVVTALIGGPVFLQMIYRMRGVDS